MNVDYSAFEGWPITGRPAVVTVRGDHFDPDGLWRVTAAEGVTGHIRFGHEVTAAHWDPAALVLGLGRPRQNDAAIRAVARAFTP